MKSFEHIYESSKIPTNKFVRYGRLDKWAKQNNYVQNKKTDLHGEKSTEITYHTAPVGRGFYAMPFGYEEEFLIGSLNATQPDLFPDNIDKGLTNPYYDENGEFIGGKGEMFYDEKLKMWDKKETKEEREYEKEINRRRNNLYKKNRKVFTLKDTDKIWHHLVSDIKKEEIEKRSGAWVYSTVKAWKSAFIKSMKILRGYQHSEWANDGKPYYDKTSKSSFSKDHLEVFVSPDRF